MKGLSLLDVMRALGYKSKEKFVKEWRALSEKEREELRALAASAS